MKAKLTAAILALVIAILSILLIPRIIVNQHWKEIDSFVKLERYQSALDVALKAKKCAKRWHLKPAYVKALLYEVKCKTSLHANLGEITRLLRAEKNSTPSPVKEIITSLYLEKLWDNYFRHRWRYENQTFLDDGDSIEAWSTKRILKEIVTNILDIQKVSKLKSTSFSSYQKQICSFSNNQIMFPTAYEFLTWHSIEILNWSNKFFYEDYIVRNQADQYFVPLKDFLKIPISKPDTFDLYTTSMVFYQDLLKFEIDNFNHKLTYELEIQRLNSLRERHQSDSADQKFQSLLENYRKYSKNKDVQLILDYALFNEYKSQEKTNDYRRKCLEVIKNYPEYKPEVIECKKMMTELAQKSISLVVSNENSSGKPVEVNIYAQNTDTVYLHLYKLPNLYNIVDNFEIKNDTIYKLLINNCIDRKSLKFKHEFSQTKRMPLIFNNLENGSYLVSIGYKKNLSDYANVTEWKLFRVTSIASFCFNDLSQTEIYAVNRKNGKPINKASISIFTYKNVKRNYVTDVSGKVRVDNKLLSDKVLIGFDKDTMAFHLGYQNHYDPEHETKSLDIQLFTDRDVYRPSQKIYFKGILNQQDWKNKKYTTVANKKIHLTFKNYSFTYGEQDLITNEFGSFKGSFQIPARVSLGEMQIETEYGDQYVRIEEYKPTKMRLTVLPYSQPPAMGDSIVVTGYARYLNGLPARSLPVSYNVTQTVRDGRHYLGSSVISSGMVLSDQIGQFRVKIKSIRNKNDVKNQFEYNYTFSMECKDEFGEIHSEICQVPAGYNSCTATIHIDQYLLKKSAIKVPVDFMYNNTPINAQKCRLTIRKLLAKTEKGEQTHCPLYNDITEIPFDSLSQGEMVFDQILQNLSSYVFNISALSQLPQGFYRAEISAVVDQKITILDHTNFTLLEKASDRLNLGIEHFFIALSNEAKPGETVSFMAGSSLPDIYGLFTLTKNEEIVSQKWIHLSKNQQLIQIPVKETFRGGFHVSFIAFANNIFYDKSFLVKVPFDNKKLHISFNSFRSNLYPGQQETWHLKVRDYTGKPAHAEMVATLYDQALDEIWPKNFAYFPYSNFEEDEYAGRNWDFLSMDNIWGHGPALKPIDVEIDRPIEGNETGSYYFPTFNWNMDKKGGGRSTFFHRSRRDDFREKDKTKFEASRISFSDLSKVNEEAPPPPPPLKSIVRFTPPEVTMDEITDETSDSKESQPGFQHPTIRLRKDFRETALFVPLARTDANGTVAFNFTMPDALTRWKMLGFAHTQDMKTGSISAELVTQKDFMVIPNWPRFFRSGDTVLLNVRIENNVAKSISGNITLEIQDASTHKPIGEKVIKSSFNQQFVLKGRANTFTQWNLVIPQLAGALLLRIKASSGASSDGEEMMVPILSNEVMITETMPFFVPDNKPKTFHFERFKKQNLTDIRQYQYVFELSPNPKWNVINALGYLTDYPFECAEQTFDKYFAYCMAEHIAKHNPIIYNFFNKKGKTNSNELESSLESNPDLKSCLLEESPWLFEAKTMSKKAVKLSEHFNNQAIEANKADLSEKIQSFQNADGGIAWFKGMESSRFISYYLLEALGKMNKLNLLGSFIEENPGFINSLLRYCDETLFRWYQDHIKSKTNFFYLDRYLLTSYAYGRSYFLKESPIPKEKKEAYNYLLKQLGSEWQKASRSQRPLIAITLYRNGNHIISNQIIESLKEFAITDPEQGMFWNFDSDYYYYSSIENQANILELFIETHQNQNDIDNVKNWLYLHKKNNYWYSTISTAKVCYSLLLNEPKWFNPASFRIDVGSYGFTASNATSSTNPGGSFRKNWSATQITKDMEVIKICPLNVEKTPTWGATYWQYFKRMDKITETSSGLWVKKLYFVKRNNEYKQVKDKENLKVGDEVMVRLDFGTDKPLSYVHLKDLRPSCLEPMDKTSGYQYQNGLGYFESIRDVSQNFFIEDLPKGNHLIEYKVRVTHRGTFQTGNATIQCMYAPEFVGNSKSTIIKAD